MDATSWLTDTADSYDRVARPYADLVQRGLADLPLEARLVDHFAQGVLAVGGGPVLDAGCGPGTLTRDLHARGLTVWGLDLSRAMLGLAREANPGVGFVAGSLTRLPIADGSLAGVFCWYVLHHVPDENLAGVVGELGRVLAPGARLLLGTHVGAGTHVKTEGYGGLPMRVLVARRHPESYARLLREAGLVVDATVAVGPDDPARGGVWLAHRPG